MPGIGTHERSLPAWTFPGILAGAGAPWVPLRWLAADRVDGGSAKRAMRFRESGEPLIQWAASGVCGVSSFGGMAGGLPSSLKMKKGNVREALVWIPRLRFDTCGLARVILAEISRMDRFCRRPCKPS